MKKRLSLLSTLLALSLLTGCEDRSEDENPSYRWVSARVNWVLVYPDSIVPKPACDVDYVFGKRYGECSDMVPNPYEGAWNCTSEYMERRGDTVFLRAYEATGPDKLWKTTFTCLDSYEPFVLQADGKGLYVGNHDLGQDPELRLNGDTLSFKMSFVLFDRAGTSDAGPGFTPFWIRYHGYGEQFTDLDSIQSAMRSYCSQHQYCLDSATADYWDQMNLIDRYCLTNTSCINEKVNVDSVLAAVRPGCLSVNLCKTNWGGEARIMVAWREFLYVPSDSVLAR